MPPSSTTKSCSRARRSPISKKKPGPHDHGDGDGHLDRIAAWFHARRVRPHLLGPVDGAAVARGRRVVRRAARAVAGDAQQLRQHVRVSRAELGRVRLPIPFTARDRRDARCSGREMRSFPGQPAPALPPSRRWRPRGQPRHAGGPRNHGDDRSQSRGRAGIEVRSIKRIVVVVVNSLSIPKTDWDQRARPPSDFVILLKATGVPIDRYSYEAVELLKDIIARWQTLRTLKESGAFANAGNPALGRAVDVPDIDLYAIDVSFASRPEPVGARLPERAADIVSPHGRGRSTVCARRRARSCVRRLSISG